MTFRPQREPRNTLTIRASLVSYIVLSGVWFLLALLYAILSLRTPGKGLELGALFAGSATLGWWVWLFGFKITVTEASLIYRDGLYRTRWVEMSDIVVLHHEFTKWKIKCRVNGTRWLAFHKLDANRDLEINTKPFKRKDLLLIRKIVFKRTCTVSSD